MTGACWVAHPAASNIPATISDRNFIRRSLAALTPCARWRYRFASFIWQRVIKNQTVYSMTYKKKLKNCVNRAKQPKTLTWFVK